MKKILIILAVVVGMSLAYAPLTNAIVQVREYTLKVGETVQIEDYLNAEITLKSLGGISTLSYPSQIRSLATINVRIGGGCGPKNTYTPVPLSARDSNKDSWAPSPPCLGMPTFENEYNVSEGQTVMALGLKIMVVSITSDTLKIQVIVPGREPTPTPTPRPTPTCRPRPACLDSTPPCLLAEPADGWCPGISPTPFPSCPPTLQPGIRPCIVPPTPTPIPIEGIIGGGSIYICPLGGTNCNICSGTRCYPKEGGVPGVTPGATPGTSSSGTPGVFTLPKNQEIKEVHRVEVKDDKAVYQIKTIKKAKLFFLIPVQPEVVYSVNSSTGVETKVSQPWWSFFAR